MQNKAREGEREKQAMRLFDSPLALVVGEGDLLELTVLEDGGGREGRSGLLNKGLGRHLEEVIWDKKKDKSRIGMNG